jgi:gluconokinase
MPSERKADIDQPPKHPDATAEMNVDEPATANLLTLFCYCQGTPELLAQRIAARQNHFMGAQMLTSQLATLEDPTQTGEPGVFAADIDGTKEEVKSRAVNGMRDLVQRATEKK